MLSSTIGSVAEQHVDGPGSLLEWAATDGPLRSSYSESGVYCSHVTLKSMLLSVS